MAPVRMLAAADETGTGAGPAPEPEPRGGEVMSSTRASHEAAAPGRARTGRWRRSLMRRLVRAPLRGWALLGYGILNVAVFSLVVTAGSLLTAGIGLLLLPPALVLLRNSANGARHRALAWSGVRIEQPYRPISREVADAPGFGGRVGRLTARLGDPQTWRDLAWTLLDGTIGVTIAALAATMVLYGICGFVVGIFWPVLTSHGAHEWYGAIHIGTKTGQSTLPRWGAFATGAAYLVGGAYAGPALVYLHGRLTSVILGPTADAREAALSNRVARLTETRADAVDTQAAELRRIERDLHDGAQARLVAMGMNLGAAEALLDQHPEAARALLVEAREASAKALTELRELVRGIHPPVLADRGLGDAVRALALDSPLRVEVTVDLPGRLEPAVESAAYFAVSELLTNVAKHARAQTVRVDLWYGAGRLRVTCTDDGRGGASAGGADAAPERGQGSGLAGIERRIGTFDGVMAVRSPVGGPTEITLEIPCASSSAKTSTS
jgi:signal transduction histidine kinase